MISLADVAKVSPVGLSGSLVRIEANKRTVTQPTGLKDRAAEAVLAQDARIHRYGLLGALLGAILGTIVQPHIPCRELMFTVIVPISTTYAGFGIGGFAAIGITKLKSKGVSKEEFEDAQNVLDRKDPRNADRLQIVLALVAVLLGAYWGWTGCAHILAPAPAVFISHLMAAISGAVISLWMGLHLGSILRLDSAPNGDC